MRIGTWNLDGRWSPAHQAFIDDLVCDLWLLTELKHGALPGAVRSAAMAGGTKSWAAVFASELHAVEPRHPVAALATFDEVLCCSVVVPWRGARRWWPGSGLGVATLTTATLRDLRPVLASHVGDIVVGGDFNHAWSGHEYSGSRAGREAIHAFVDELELQVPTHEAPHRLQAALTIDHIAVPRHWAADVACRHVAKHDARRLSDHDAYTVEIDRP